MELNKRQIQKMETRQKIMDTAYEIYSQKGFTAPTSDISKALNISHGTLFVHFPTKEDLICCVIEDFGHKTAQLIHDLTENSHGLEEILKCHVQCIEENEKFYTKLISELSILPDEVKNTVISIQSTIAFHFSVAADKEKQNHRIKNIDTHLLFNNWLGFLHYYMQNGFMFAPSSSVLKRYGEELTKTFYELIKN